MTKKVSTESQDIVQEKIDELKKLFPEIVSEGKIDFDKLKLTLGKEVDVKEEKFSFNWVGRKNSFENLQTTAKGTLIPFKNESINFDLTKNVFIEGDNLEVMKLLQKSYFGKIKMIFIDPPYNTGKDFLYKDNFRNSIQSYLQQTGQTNGEGIKLTTNPETNGRFHSDWITMMYPRLFIARNLLRDDGAIFISIDDTEFHNLRMIMDEIFGEENFVATIIWEKAHTRKNSAKYFSVSHDYVVLYAKNKENWKRNLLERNGKSLYKNPDNDPKGSWKPDPVYANNPYKADYVIEKPNGIKLKRPKGKYWRFSKSTFDQYVKEGRVIWGQRKSYPMVKRYLSEVQEGLVPVTLFDRKFAGDNSYANNELKKLFETDKIMDYPKPSLLIRRLMEISTTGSDEDIVMDFFCGSGTTAQAVLDLNYADEGNRKFICIQLPELTKESSEAYKTGLKTISDIAKERIRRVIKKLKNENGNKLIKKQLDLGFKVFKLQKSNYKIWEDYEGKDKKELTKQLQLFKNPLISGYKENNVIYECIIKEGYSLNSKIENTGIKTNTVFKVLDDGQFFYICLDHEIKDMTIEKLGLKKDTLLICLDESLNDSKKTNLAIQCNLKTI